ncbi:2-dehydro-3-deoxygalactonokinase [Paenibacillus pasadenensis]|uniref:2-dehydro-3-deoxygalactonokinase n=1 Tax=Paenibacillus pasadenensis TaxID=217090 RepID=UPI00203C9469|nr:2-dehydro-3-deoxygalactonokinase [Paenibacillus pasadenensis]MCM3745913.1 2-dehydro-3-deoxygalactonokinase [Paenibacillus pasadenensis]
MLLFVIDAGTTTSRIRLTDGKNVLASAKRQVGARDVAITGDKRVLEQALKECVDELLLENRLSLAQIDAVFASGMISSNMGLYEIPHLEAPVNLEQLASKLVVQSFPGLSDKPVIFIPGVKTGFDAVTELEDKDMMRGEEAEIFGYLNSLGENKNDDILFMHYGSHHKCIQLIHGGITKCRTSITGELMTAVAQHTILKSSLLPLEEVVPEIEWVKKGLHVAHRSGFGRVLFSTRVLDTMEQRSSQEVSSLFLGALLSLDLKLVEEMITEQTNRIVLYGKALFPSVFEPVLREVYPELQVEVISEEISDLLSAEGAASIYQQYAK